MDDIDPPPIPPSVSAMDFRTALFHHELQPQKRYHLAADSMMLAAEVGMCHMRCTPACRSLRHLGSRPGLGHVLWWDHVNPFSIGSTPLCVAFSHSPLNGSSCSLAVADSAGNLAVCDPSAWNRLRDIWPCVQANESTIVDMDWASDDSYIATASIDSTVRISSVTQCRLHPLLLLKSSMAAVTSVACHPMDAKLLASGSAVGYVSVWDTRSRKTLCIVGSHEQHLSISPRRSVVPPMAATWTTALRSETGIEFLNKNRSVTGIEFLTENSMISSSAGGQVCLWDTRQFARPTLSVEGIFSLADAQLQTISCVRVSPCRTRAAFLTTGGYCCVQNLSRWTSAQHEAHGCKVIALNPLSRLHLENECKLEWSPCGRFIACGSNDADKCIHMIDMALGDVVMKLLGHSRAVIDVTWNKNSTGLISTSCDGFIRTWCPTMPHI
jgi:WD40 repeat protein